MVPNFQSDMFSSVVLKNFPSYLNDSNHGSIFEENATELQTSELKDLEK